jgi:hypothetical protein
VAEYLIIHFIGDKKMIQEKITLSVIVFTVVFSNVACSCLAKKDNVNSNKILYGKYTELMICNCEDSCDCRNNNSDTLCFVKGYPIVFKQAEREWKEDVEVFEPSDTLERDTLCIYERCYTVDALSGLESQYSGVYDFGYAFLVHNKKQEYIILLFYNLYQMGTDIQCKYIIFKLDKDKATFCASYIENLNYPLSKTRIVTKKSGVYLKSKNLDRCL